MMREGVRGRRAWERMGGKGGERMGEEGSEG